MDKGFVHYVVNKYLRGKPHLAEYREDLLQEGHMAMIRAESDFDPAYGVDKKLYVHYAIKQAVYVYIRKEVRHFKKKVVDPESQYWDLSPYLDMESVVDESQSLPDKDRLADFTERISMTERQREILEMYLRTGDYSVAAMNLDISRQAVHKVIQDIVKSCMELLDKETS